MGIIAWIDVGLTAGLPANIPLPGKDHGALFYLQSLVEIGVDKNTAVVFPGPAASRRRQPPPDLSRRRYRQRNRHELAHRQSGMTSGHRTPHLPLTPRRTAMRRRTFDILMAAAGLFLAITLIAAGVLLTWAHTFIGNEVHTQLAAQQIYFPPANSKAVAAPEFAAMRPYGGQQLTTGAQAQVYADHFIANHLKEIGGGKTYAQLSARPSPSPITPCWRPRSPPCSRARPCAACCSTPTPSAPWA